VKPFFQHLSTNGDGTGLTSLAIDVSSLGNATFVFTGGGVEDEWTLSAHALTVGAKVQFSAVGTGATGASVSTDYWVKTVPTANTFQLSATKGGAVLEGTENSSGTWTIDRQPEDFYLAGPATYDDYAVVARIVVFAQDTGAMDAGGYGNGSALSNGITLKVTTADGTELIDLTPTPITTNGMWAAYCYDTQVQSWGTGDEILMARWTFTKSYGPGLELNHDSRLVATVNDDMTHLVNHLITAEGYRTNEHY